MNFFKIFLIWENKTFDLLFLSVLIVSVQE